MLLTHGPFVCLLGLVTLFAPFTWASLPRRQAVPISPGVAYSPVPEGSPTLAPGWSPTPPVLSPPTAAPSTSAPGWSYVYPPQPTTPYQSDTSGPVTPTLSSPTSVCTPWGQCNVFYQVSNFYPNTCTLCIHYFQWVTVFYWPQATQNTACIPQATGVPLGPLPPGMAGYDPTISYNFEILLTHFSERAYNLQAYMPFSDQSVLLMAAPTLVIPLRILPHPLPRVTYPP